MVGIQIPTVHSGLNQAKVINCPNTKISCHVQSCCTQVRSEYLVSSNQIMGCVHYSGLKDPKSSPDLNTRLNSPVDQYLQ